MREHLDPEVARRCRTIAYISAVAMPVLIYFGLQAEAPASAMQWIGRCVLVLIALFPEPAIYLTMNHIFRVPTPISLVVALSPAAVVGWFWVIRWIV